MNRPNESKEYTYDDWKKWDGQWELINGKAYNMTPAPTPEHQYVLGELFLALRLFFGNKECRTYMSPFDVYFSETEDYEHPDHIVQPDISVICNKNQMNIKGCYGAPVIVIEVLSPSTALKDYNEKFYIYQNFGVQEYWIVDPKNKFIHVHFLEDSHYKKRKTFGENEKLHSFAFRELEVTLNFWNT